MRSSNRETSGYVILTLLFPFIGLIESLVNWRKPWAKNVFWLACIYVGAIFIFHPEGKVLGSGADGGRYALELQNMFASNADFDQVLGSYLSDEFHLDLYQPIVTFIVSRFTDNGHVLFTLYALVFGFFYSRNMWYVLERIPHNKKIGILWVLIALFFLACTITAINGVRMWTALHVYVYAMMPYLWERDRSKLWWVIVTPLIHFSFLYIAIFALAYCSLPERLKIKSNTFLLIAFVLYIGTLFVNSISLDALSEVATEYAPDSYERKVELYVNQDYADRRSEAQASYNWYITLSGVLKKWIFNLIFILLLPCIKRYFKSERNIINLYLFTLLFGSLANILALIPSGGRFQLVALMFKLSLFLLVLFRIPHDDRLYKVVGFACLLLILSVVVDIRTTLDYVGITLVFGNFFTALFLESNIPIIDFIKDFIS